MADIQISVAAGSQTRLLTAQKYCPSDILVVAENGDNSMAGNLEGALFDITGISVSSVRDYALDYSTAQRINIGVEESVGIRSFSNNPSLLICRFVGSNSITVGGSAFASDTNNSLSIIMDYPSVCTLSSTSALNGVVGNVYVPDNLVEQYKVSTNWTTYANQIKGLSEIPPEVQEWLDQQGGAV